MAWERTGPAVDLWTEDDRYREACLTLSWPRSVPDCYDSDAISQQLREWTLENRDSMPWHGFADHADEDWEK